MYIKLVLGSIIGVCSSLAFSEGKKLEKMDALRRLIIFRNGEVKGEATGFFISPKLLVTAHHVIEGEEKGLEKGLSKMEILGGKDYFEFKKIIGFSEENDIALIEVEKPDGRDEETAFLKLSSEQPKKRDTVFKVGYQKGQLKVFKSIITGVMIDKNLIEFETKTVPFTEVKNIRGMSGGPVINDREEVIGVIIGSLWLRSLFWRSKFNRTDYVSSILHLKEFQPVEKLWPVDKAKTTIMDMCRKVFNL